jgi:hypothetical protein
VCWPNGLIVLESEGSLCLLRSLAGVASSAVIVEGVLQDRRSPEVSQKGSTHSFKDVDPFEHEFRFYPGDPAGKG